MQLDFDVTNYFPKYLGRPFGTYKNLGVKILERPSEIYFDEARKKLHDTIAFKPLSKSVKNKFLHYSVDELLNEPFPAWAVKNLIPAEGLFSVYGPSGSGKSFLVLYLLSQIATGSEVFGNRSYKRPVAYICFEGWAGLSLRIKAHTKHYGKPDIDFIRPQGVNLLNADDCWALAESLRSHMIKGGVVCIDTLAASSAGMDENSAEGMGLLISRFQDLQIEIGGLVMVVHHTGKDPTKGLRGWSGLKGALDGSISVVKVYLPKRRGTPTDEPQLFHPTERIAIADKLKDAKDGDGFKFDLEQVFLDYDDDGDPITSCVVTEQEVISQKASGEDTTVTDNEIDEIVYGWIADALANDDKPSIQYLNNALKESIDSNFSQRQLREARQRLRDAGRIEQIGTGKNSTLVLKVVR